MRAICGDDVERRTKKGTSTNEERRRKRKPGRTKRKRRVREAATNQKRAKERKAEMIERNRKHLRNTESREEMGNKSGKGKGFWEGGWERSKLLALLLFAFSSQQLRGGRLAERKKKDAKKDETQQTQG
jgi:hypothetical protein